LKVLKPMQVSHVHWQSELVAHTVAEVGCCVLVKVQGLLQVAPAVDFLSACAIRSRRVALMSSLNPLSLAGMRTARVTIKIRPLSHGFWFS
jgi:hypothetical protein